MKILEIKNLSFRYPKSENLFENLDFLLGSQNKCGNIVSIMGPSGSGKTTLLKLILGILTPNKGSIKLNPSHAILSYVPQESVLFEHLSPYENATFFKNTTSNKERFDLQFMNEVTALFNMQTVLNNKTQIDKLSGGERQRLSLIRALSIKPDVLILDEPCTGLDSEVKHAFLLKIRELAITHKLLILYVTHHIDEATLISDEIAYLISTKNNNIINNIQVDNLKDFLNIPPSIFAAHMAYFPESCILKCSYNNGVVDLDSDGEYFMLLKNKNIIINNSGWKFDIVNTKGLYTHLVHKKSNNNMTIYKEISSERRSVNLDIIGDVYLYDKFGVFKEQISI